MIYTLTPSPFTSVETLVVFTPEAPLSDVMRGRALAESLKGRWSRAAGGHLMTAVNAAKWETLFTGGWSVETVYVRHVKTYAYNLGERHSYPLCDAITATRNMISV